MDVITTPSGSTDPAGREARLLQRAPWAVLELDAALRVTWWNERAAQIFGVSAGDALGREAPALLPADDELWARVAADADGERRATHPREGGARTVAWTWRRDGDMVACYGRDLTAEVAEESERLSHERLLAAIIDNVSVVVWAMDRRGYSVYHEGRGVDATGMRRGQLVGTNLLELYDRTGGDQILRDVLGGKVMHMDSEEYGVAWENWMIPARDARGEVTHVVGVALNVTELKRGEQELRAQLARIEEQQQVIRELSTPIIEVWDHVLTLPIIGMVDSVRAAEIMDNLLQSVARSRARFAILDMTGVEVLDTGTAGHLLGLVRAIGLLGAEGVVTGIHPNIAQTIVALGLDLSRLTVRASLRDALKYCIQRLGDGKRRP